MEYYRSVLITVCFLAVVGILAQPSMANRANSTAALLAFTNLASTRNETVHHQQPKRTASEDPTITALRNALYASHPLRKAFMYRTLFAVYVKTRYNGTFSPRQCQQRQCSHGNKRYNCGATQTGNTVEVSKMQPSGNGNCANVDIQEHGSKGLVCYAELWLNNEVVRSLVRGAIPGQRGVLSVRSTAQNQTMAFAMNSTARLTRRWVKLDVARLTRTWAMSGGANYSLEICWRPMEPSAVLQGKPPLPEARLKRLHTETLDFNATMFANSSSFFILGVIGLEKPTLPTLPKSTGGQKFNRGKSILTILRGRLTRAAEGDCQLVRVRRTDLGTRPAPICRSYFGDSRACVAVASRPEVRVSRDAEGRYQLTEVRTPTQCGWRR